MQLHVILCACFQVSFKAGVFEELIDSCKTRAPLSMQEQVQQRQRQHSIVSPTLLELMKAWIFFPAMLVSPAKHTSYPYNPFFLLNLLIITAITLPPLRLMLQH